MKFAKEPTLRWRGYPGLSRWVTYNPKGREEKGDMRAEVSTTGFENGGRRHKPLYAGRLRRRRGQETGLPFRSSPADTLSSVCEAHFRERITKPRDSEPLLFQGTVGGGRHRSYQKRDTKKRP